MNSKVLERILSTPLIAKFSSVRTKSDDYFVATVSGTMNDRYEYAEMFAAAPDMLKALKPHVEYETLPTDRGGSSGPKGKAWAAFIEARDAALAKVEGEKS